LLLTLAVKGGSRLWKLQYRGPKVADKHTMHQITLGSANDLTVTEARELRAEFLRARDGKETTVERFATLFKAGAALAPVGPCCHTVRARRRDVPGGRPDVARYSDSMKPITSSQSSFRGAAESREPGIQTSETLH
jgi:hypothetical protein